MKLWLVRHAPVTLPPGVCYGISDVPADLELTREAAHRLAKQMPPNLLVWVSGLKRAQQLCEALVALRPDLQHERTDSRLNEMNFGCWELQPWDAIPRPAIDRWVEDFARHRFGEQESAYEVVARVRLALLDLSGRVGANGEAVWVTHAGVMRAVRFLANGVGEAGLTLAHWPTSVTSPGSCEVVEMTVGCHAADTPR